MLGKQEPTLYRDITGEKDSSEWSAREPANELLLFMLCGTNSCCFGT